MNNLGLYIHIPFCVRKCNYCDFLSAPCDDKTRQEYVEALCREIVQRAVQFKNKKVDTVFFGGGTPSILSAEQITKVMSIVRAEFQILPEAEISIEMNPGTVDREKLETYKKLGINRLSIGLQSADNRDLKTLGRIHTWETFLHTWELVRKTGFSNVNIDLMSALPGQTLESYEETLKRILVLKPEHISAYSLIIEEGTPFFEWFGEEGRSSKQSEENEIEQQLSNLALEIIAKKLPDENTERQMYECTGKLLEESGYERYEISNYALKGYECKHNIGYWKRKDYVGFGLGAASLLNNVRFQNETDLNQYMEKVSCGQDIVAERQELSKQEQMEEFMFLGLRMMDGISPLEFEEQFGQSLDEVYGKQIQKLKKQQLLKWDYKNKRYSLTGYGIDVSNQVFVEFLF